jgi:hypothetical protein
MSVDLDLTKSQSCDVIQVSVYNLAPTHRLAWISKKIQLFGFSLSVRT